MSARHTRGGDLKDSKGEEGGEEAVAMAEAETAPDLEMMTRCDDADDDYAAAVVTWNAESNRDSKKRRVSTKEASIEFLECAKSSSEASGEVDVTSLIDGAGGKVGGVTLQCGAAAGQTSMSESTAHREVSVDDTHASADIGSLGSGESVGGAAVTAAASYKSVISSMARANESNIFTAENYYLLHWLYRIRNVSCLRGLRISFLQPDFLWSIYRPMMRSRKLWRTDGDIRVAADLWCSDRAAAEERYGHISDWDVSSVTDMSELFHGQANYSQFRERYRGKDVFNDDISRWDVSHVTNMGCMFFGAYSFNQAIGGWDVSNVTNLSHMFYAARSFNQPIMDWDVSKVTNMESMFNRAHVFNQPIGNWVVSEVTDMSGMFNEALGFNQPVGSWDVSEVTDMQYMFCDAHAFNQSVGSWDVSEVTGMQYMFSEAHEFNQPVGTWDVSKVTRTDWMFSDARAFNQAIGDWDVSSVTNMRALFLSARSFDQDLTRWDMRLVGDTEYMFSHADAMQRHNKPAAVRDDVYDDSDDDEGEWEEAGAGV